MSTTDRATRTIWLSGGSGFIGAAVYELLTREGDHIVKLVRRPTTRSDELEWDVARGVTDPRANDTECDAVVHLAGESLAARRLTTAQKRKITASRVPATRALCESIVRRARKPELLIAASGVGYYGSCGDVELTEKSAGGHDFIARLADEWERACQPARDAGIRVVNLRIGMVLHPAGGALQKMLPPFRLGVGGPLGNGRQYVSWISRRDLGRIVEFALLHPEMSGPVNAVSPHALTMNDFARALAAVLRRPAFFRVPKFVLTVLFGKELAEMVLTSTRVRPDKLQRAGFQFEDVDLRTALRGMRVMD
jgi:uncharacterized protein (TIGR01777 family)